MKMLIVFVSGVICALAINAHAQQVASHHAMTNFAIELSIDKADKGCAWETLSFSCDPSGVDCEGTFDQFSTPAE